jgi:1,4-alpha-glucan branching enzyme
LLRAEPALYAENYTNEGFQWIDYGDHQNSVMSYLRIDPNTGEEILVACNFTPTTHQKYLLGAPQGNWKLIFNSDDADFGGSGFQPTEDVSTESIASHGRKDSLVISLPGLAVVAFKKQ